MSSTLTARSRAVVALLAAILVAVTWSTAIAGGEKPARKPAETPPVVTEPASVEPAPEIGTALQMVRNADGTVTVTES